MRGFSLVGLLVVIAIMFYVFTMNTSQVAKTNATIKPQVQQLAGQNEDGTKAIDKIKLSPIERNGVLKAVKVESIAAGALLTYWGLQANDEIQEIGQFRIGDPTMEGFDDVRNWVSEGMQRKTTMKVNRAGNVITLPQ